MSATAGKNKLRSGAGKNKLGTGGRGQGQGPEETKTLLKSYRKECFRFPAPSPSLYLVALAVNLYLPAPAHNFYLPALVN